MPPSKQNPGFPNGSWYGIPPVAAFGALEFSTCVSDLYVSTRDMYVAGPADIFALRYEIAQRNGVFDYGAAQSPQSPQLPNAGTWVASVTGGTLLTTPLAIAPGSPWNVNIWAKEILQPSDLPAPTLDEILSRGTQASILKAMVGWVQYPGRLRQIMIDIGTGLDITVGPSTQVCIDVMVPVPDSAPPIRPPEFGDGTALSFYTYVVASVMCVTGPIPSRGGCYTQSAFLTGEQTEVEVPVADESRRVQVFQANDAALDVSFLMNPPFGDLLPGPIDLGGVNVQDFQTGKVLVPQNAKSIRLQGSGGIVTVRQELQR